MRGFDLAELLPGARVEVWVGAGAQKTAVLCAAPALTISNDQ